MKKEKMNGSMKYLILVFGAFAIFFTGYPHIWSIYQPYAIELTGWTQGQASMCFYLSFVTFVLGNIVGGRIPRSVIEEFRKDNEDILKTCGFYDEEPKETTSTVVPDDRTNMLVAGVGIGATVMGVIAALISGKK